MNGEKEHKRTFLKRFRIGMRIVKTVVAVFICCIIDYLRVVSPFQSTMAAIICIQPDTENTVNTAISRVLATLLGSVSAALLLMIFSGTNIEIPSIPFYLLLSILLIPLILITVRMGWPSSTALTCIVFLAVALDYTGKTNLFAMAMERMTDTLVGILVALAVNVLIPNRLAVVTGISNQSGEEQEDQ